MNLEEIPSFIIELRNLKSLDISYNKLAHLNGAIAHIGNNLEKIDDKDNKLTKFIIPNFSIRHLRCLEKIDLRNNSELKELPEDLWTLPRLEEVLVDHHLYFYLPQNIIKRIKLNPTYVESIKSLIILGRNKIPLKNDEINHILNYYRILLK